MKSVSLINFITHDEMYELYILKNLTINEIGEMYGVKYKRVTEILKKLGIKKSKEARVKNSINCKRKLKENDPNYGLSEANKNITRDVLYNAYIIQDMSIEDCGKFFGTSVTSIHRLCKKFSIHKEVIHPKKSVSRKIPKNNKYTKIPKDELFELYITQNKTISEVCAFYNISKTILLKALRYNNIKKSLEKAVEARKQAMFKKYGVDSFSKTEEFKEKIERTHLKNCGYKSNFQDPSFREKTIETNLKRYGVQNTSQLKETREKAKQTCLKRYGVEFTTQLDEVKNKIRNTNIKRYGVSSYSKTAEFLEKLKETNLKHCGETSNMKTQKFKEQCEQTNLRKYGFKHPMESEEIKRKVFSKKKRNKTMVSSSFEESISKLLKKRFSFLERQYFSIVYPFACDFYIPELDLYIEYQGHFSHGKEPFNPHKEEHIKKVELWKSKNKRSYNDAINVWTVRDPLKRETARKNNLNWIEFFTMDQFMEWYNAC